MDSIFDDAAIVLLLVNEKREVVDINKSGEIFSGNRRSDVLGLLAGQAISCVNAKEDGKPVCGNGVNCGQCIIRQCVANTFVTKKNNYKKEGIMHISSNGEVSLVNVLVSTSLINYEGNTMALVTLDDITRQKSIENKLKDVNAMKDKFFSIMAHDLKNPFNSILGYSELLFDSCDSNGINEEQKIFVKYLYNSSKHAYSLLEDLLTWARIQMDRYPYNPSYISLLDVITENIQINKSGALKKNIEIVFPDSKDINVFADKFMVSTVVRNIISNAIKFTNEKGKIAVRFNEVSPKFVRIEIEDNGVGIQDNVIDKLFRIEENHSSLGTEGERGTGLGLVLCKEFVEINNGEIGVESEYGKGSVFWFTLPLTGKTEL